MGSDPGPSPTGLGTSSSNVALRESFVVCVTHDTCERSGFDHFVQGYAQTARW